MYLAAAGIGRIGLVDYDVVDYTNLQRQIIHGTKDVGRPKLESARDRILDINPHIQLDLYEVPLTSDNALEIFEPYDVIIDGTDNFPTRYLTNDACVFYWASPMYMAASSALKGKLRFFMPKRGPATVVSSLNHRHQGLVPSCAEGGVLGILPGTIGAIQATEAIKLLLGIGEPLIGRLLLYDALNMNFDYVRLRKNPKCPVCSVNPTLTELIDYEQFCGMPAHDRSEFTTSENGQDEAVSQMSPAELRARLDKGDNLFILDVREPHEWDISNLSGLGAVLIPKGDVLERMGELDTAQEMVVQCRSGARSADVIRQLRQHGFKKMWNLDGGINRWAQEVDNSLPTY